MGRGCRVGLRVVRCWAAKHLTLLRQPYCVPRLCCLRPSGVAQAFRSSWRWRLPRRLSFTPGAKRVALRRCSPHRKAIATTYTRSTVFWRINPPKCLPRVFIILCTTRRRVTGASRQGRVNLPPVCARTMRVLRQACSNRPHKWWSTTRWWRWSPMITPILNRCRHCVRLPAPSVSH